jgi:hypothetical protein
MSKITVKRDVEDCGREAALAATDKEYEGALRAMLGYIRQTVNSSEVKTVDNLTDAFRDSRHAIGGVMLRAEMVYHSLTKPEITDRAKFAHEIKRDRHADLDGRNHASYWNSDSKANDAAYNAYDDFWFGYEGNAELLATLPVLQYLDRNGLTGALQGQAYLIGASECGRLLLQSAPLTAKRHPLLGYGEAEIEDHISAPCSGSFGDFGNDFFDDFELMPRYEIKLNKEFVGIFADRLQRFYDANHTGNSDYYAVIEMRKQTHRAALRLFVQDGFDHAERVYQTISRYVDCAERGVTIDDDFFKSADVRTVWVSDDILTRCESITGVTYAVNKQGMLRFVDIIEVLNLADVLPEFERLGERICALS